MIIFICNMLSTEVPKDIFRVETGTAAQTRINGSIIA